MSSGENVVAFLWDVKGGRAVPCNRNATYRADPDDETLMGHSLGGLFGLYVLLNHPDSFDRHVVGSPSIRWDDSVSFTFEEALAASGRDLDARVFLSTGSLETTEMISNTRQMFERLRGRNHPSLDVEHHVFEGDDHISVLGATFNRGLRSVFGCCYPRLSE